MSKKIFLAILAVVSGWALQSYADGLDEVVVKTCTNGEGRATATFRFSKIGVFTVTATGPMGKTITAGCKIKSFEMTGGEDSINELVCTGQWSTGENGQVFLASADGVLNIGI